VNRAILVGRLGRDPEVKATASGSHVATLSVATNERRKVDGEWADHTEWHRVVCFGRTAENAGRYLAKGSQLVVEGRLQTDKWTDKDGNTRYTTEVVADRIEFVGSKGSKGGDSSSYGGTSKSSQTAGADDDIPF